MAKKTPPNQNHLDPSGSKVRPGMRRSMAWLVRTGKVPALLIGALCGWGMYDALTSPRYEIESVEAVGIQALTPDDVRTFAAVDRQSIWYVDTDEVSERVRQSPYVQDVRTRVILPNRIEVAVAERKPEVRWMHDGIVYAVTWDGIVVDREGDAPPPAAAATAAPVTTQAPVEGAPPEGEPVEGAPAEGEPVEGAPVEGVPADATAVEGAPVEGVPPEGVPTDAAPPAATEAPPAAQPTFESAVTIVDTTPDRTLAVGDHVDPDALELARRISLRAPTELPMPITRIEWDAGLGVSIILADNRQAVIGRSDNLDQKLAILRYTLQDGTVFSYFDLRSSTPYYK